MICDQWDVIIVPFPFTERAGEKHRPALVVSRWAFNQSGHTVLAMITSAAHRAWPGDSALADPEAAGLRLPCIVRLKLFTLDHRVIFRRIGQVTSADRRAVEKNLRAYVL